MDELSHLHPHGVFLRREAVEAGYPDKALYAALGSGQLVRVRQGAYVDGATWNRADELGQHRLRAHAAGMVHAAPFAMSHQTGAALHGMRLWGVDLSRVHIARHVAAVGRKHRDVAYHLQSTDGSAVVQGTPVLSAVASAVGAACTSSVEAGMVILDSAYDLGLCTPEDVMAEYESNRRRPGAARLQITLRLARPGSQSVGESRMRHLFWSQRIPRPELQYVVRDSSGAVVGISDFAWPEYGVLGEFDGRIKYDQLLRPGESSADAVVREKLREDRMREITGWRFIRFMWPDLYDPARTAERVRRALSAR